MEKKEGEEAKGEEQVEVLGRGGKGGGGRAELDLVQL